MMAVFPLVDALLRFPEREIWAEIVTKVVRLTCTMEYSNEFKWCKKVQ